MKRSRSGNEDRRAPQARWLVAAILCAAFFAIDLPASEQAGSDFTLKNGSRLWLDGTSTMHAFTSTATQVQVAFKQDTAKWPGPVFKVEEVEQVMREGGVSALEVRVPVAEMRSGKSGLDRNMQKALKAVEHPAIIFRLERYEVAPGTAPEEFVVNAHGRLTVAGVERATDLSVTARRESDGIRLRGKKQLLMSQFEIRPPKMMMGAVRTGDQVTVGFDLMIGLGGPPPSSAQR